MHKVSILIHISRSSAEREFPKQDRLKLAVDGIPFTGDVAQCKTPVAFIPFQFRDGAAWYVMDEAGENRKINANGKGWLAFSSGGVLFVKKFPDLADGEAAPAEAEIQVYVNTGKTFVEIEEQGAYTTLAPGEKLDWTVRWYLLPQTWFSRPCCK